MRQKLEMTKNFKALIIDEEKNDYLKKFVEQLADIQGEKNIDNKLFFI